MTARTQTAPQGSEAQTGRKAPEQAELIKAFDRMTDVDIEALRRAIEEIKAYSNSATAQCIQLAGARACALPRPQSKGRAPEEDKRVIERAKARGAEAIAALRMYFSKIDEESNGAAKTVR